ncbi:MAG: nucleoside triphosphate pyrophosphatase [Halocynthiibacter sp.]
MSQRIILASGSEIRQALLKNAGVSFETEKPDTDEQMILAGLQAKAATPPEIASTLAARKAVSVSRKAPDCLVIGCDQVLELAGRILTKPASQNDAIGQLRALHGTSHCLFSAIVICENGAPVWRHVGKARLWMHALSDAYIDDYVADNWGSIRQSVGAYKLEEQGARLISRIEGDYFTVLGLPLIELLSYLSDRGTLPR